jgi:hypothetical protein
VVTRSPSVQAARVDERLQRRQPLLRIGEARPDVDELRLALRQLHGRALLLARMGHLRRDIGAAARQRQLFFRFLELAGGAAQLVAGDEALVEQRLELVVLLPQPLHLLGGHLEPRPDFRDAQRALALGDGAQRRCGLLALALGHLDVHLQLAQLLLDALDVALQLGGVEADDEVAVVHAHALRRELDDLDVAPGHRRSVGDRFNRPQRAAGGELRRQGAAAYGGDE